MDSVGRKADYVKSILGRSEKIVNGLNLTSDYTRKNVVNIVCNRYFYLSDCEDKLKGDALQAELYRHHFEFAAALGNYLSDKEIEAVKDGMTYGVVPKTYQAYQDMIPSLKENEKLQILNWLKEAREFAVDAGTSKAKHGWFGKYKGQSLASVFANDYQYLRWLEENNDSFRVDWPTFQNTNKEP